ncbi:MAG TPA: CARDB domain-containing protein, partial [Pyrinomonadaceae bacterium]|nr:CARDB domain-containing protein [Pyrinomonadaceae bacterium]
MNLKRSISKKSVPPAVAGGSRFVRRRRALIGPVVIVAMLLTASALARPDIAARVWNSTAGLVGKKILATRSSNAAVAKTNAPITPPPPAPPNFNPGDLVVFQADAILNNTTFSIVELSPTIPGQTGSGVQTIAISGTGANALRASGSATSTGYLATTNDGTLLSFDAHNSSTTSPTNANTLNPRGVGTFNSAGTFALQTTYTGTSGNQARSATSLNNTTWFIGDQGGFYSNGAVSASPTGNPRSVKSFGGTVYAFTASTSVAPVGTISAPTGGTFTGLPGLANGAVSRQDFYLISSGINGATFDVLYVLDATSASAGTIFKYSLVGGSWTANGSYTTSFGGFGLAAAGSGTGAVLFVTTGTGATAANSVIKLTDTAGYNSTITITTANNVTLFTAPAGTADKGIAFAPLSAAAPDLTTAVTGPSTGTVGTAYDYTIKVNNSGAASATGVKETFTLPSGVTFNTASGTDSFSCSEALGVVTCTGGSVTNGNGATITVNVTPTGAGTITLPAGAAVADPDAAIAESNENNNSSTIAFTTDTTENLPPGTYSSVTVNSGVAVTMTGNITVTGCLTVNSGGTLNLGGNIISGSGCFTVNSGGTLAIGDPNGITTSGASGNVQVSGTRTFSTGASYVYAGNANQAVGNGLPATVANLKIANTGSVGNNTVTNNANQVVTGTLEIVTGIYSSHSDYVDVLIDVGGTLTLAADITVSGNWTNNGTFNNGGFKVTCDGATNQTIGGSNPSAFATLAISNTGAAGNNTVSLAQNISDTALNVTSGVFDQGASYNLASGAVTISGGATWKDIGTGDITLAGSVANSGTININGGTVVCGETQDVSISSSAGQRAWSGLGTFVIKDVHVSNQGGTALIHVENGSDD